MLKAKREVLFWFSWPSKVDWERHPFSTICYSILTFFHTLSEEEEKFLLPLLLSTRQKSLVCLNVPPRWSKANTAQGFLKMKRVLLFNTVNLLKKKRTWRHFIHHNWFNNHLVGTDLKVLRGKINPIFKLFFSFVQLCLQQRMGSFMLVGTLIGKLSNQSFKLEVSKSSRFFSSWRFFFLLLLLQ